MYDREPLIAAVGRGARVPPPTWWLEQQRREGRAAAMFNIWWNRYDASKRAAQWMLAADEDFEKVDLKRFQT